MDHIAIMNKSRGMIPKILSGKKSIESRWYQTKRNPRNNIHIGDIVYFKDSGALITAKAFVKNVIQYNLDSIEIIKTVLKKYGDKICLVESDPYKWKSIPKYCILVVLENPISVPPFQINKKGFGIGNAWLTLKDIRTIIV